MHPRSCDQIAGYCLINTIDKGNATFSDLIQEISSQKAFRANHMALRLKPVAVEGLQG